MFDLDEPRPAALITGASSGIGRAFAEKLARRGNDLVLVARRDDRLEELAAELRDGREITVEVLRADLADPADLERVTGRIDRERFSLVVNNAGFGAYGEFAEIARERHMAQIDVNVRSVTAIAHAALGSMKRAGEGTLINVGASSGFQPGPYMATYAATKAYVLSLSEALHEEAHEYGVTVTCVCPGPVRTEFAEVAGVDTADWPDLMFETPERVAQEALSAARSRRALTVPGMAQKVTMVGNRFVPRFASRKLAGIVLRQASMSAKGA